MSFTQTLGTIVSLSIILGAFAAFYYPIYERKLARRAKAVEHVMKETIQAAIAPVVAKIDQQFTQVADDRVRKFDATMTKIDKRFDANDAATRHTANEVIELKTKVNRELGGNSGGLRQAVDHINSDLSRLEGAFDEHVNEFREQRAQSSRRERWLDKGTTSDRDIAARERGDS